MKKLLFTVLLCVIFAASAMAQYTGPTIAKSTVSEALQMSDDAYVMLTGKIVKHHGGSKYSFSDGTGTINVEIKNRLWTGLTVGADDTVTIVGEIDKDFLDMEVEVRSISK